MPLHLVAVFIDTSEEVSTAMDVEHYSPTSRALPFLLIVM
jgi:hypothetical protein